MPQDVSKVRARRARTLNKQAGRVQTGPTPLFHRPVIGLLLAVLVWVIVTLLLGIESFAASGVDAWTRLLSKSVFLLAGLLVSGVFLESVGWPRKPRNVAILILGCAALLGFLPSKAIAAGLQTYDFCPPRIAVFLMPYAVAPLMATLLLGSAAGWAAGAWTALAIAHLAPMELRFHALVTGLVVSGVTVRCAHDVRTRTRAARTGLAAGVAAIACVLGLTLVQWRASNPTVVLYQAGACLLSGSASAILVLLVLPAFESAFDVATNISLLELSDLGHPLLQRLAIEAPGTYHHSLVVASLAQAAADEIGANSLLTRVAAYFHDIGKLTKPGFFTENIRTAANPHDELPPSMSTLVITAHVKEGLSLARLHKLPSVIKDVIREHHGTSVLACFHHKAREQHEAEKSGQQKPPGPNGRNAFDDGAFRYPGPTPTSRETSIICLADPVEAASRSLEKTTPTHLEGLVEDIVASRVQDGQLDRSLLTFAEVRLIKRSFVFNLTNMLHARVAYPKDDDRAKQRPEAPPPPQGEGSGTGATPRPAG